MCCFETGSHGVAHTDLELPSFCFCWDCSREPTYPPDAKSFLRVLRPKVRELPLPTYHISNSVLGIYTWTSHQYLNSTGLKGYPPDPPPSPAGHSSFYIIICQPPGPQILSNFPPSADPLQLLLGNVCSLHLFFSIPPLPASQSSNFTIIPPPCLSSYPITLVHFWLL